MRYYFYLPFPACVVVVISPCFSGSGLEIDPGVESGFRLRRTKIKYLECNFNDVTHEANVEVRLDT